MKSISLHIYDYCRSEFIMPLERMETTNQYTSARVVTALWSPLANHFRNISLVEYRIPVSTFELGNLESPLKDSI